MRKIHFMMWMLTLLAVLPGARLSAQQMPQLPMDPDVRYGKLENGLTYYVRANKLPENRVNFYIAQKVGSIQEEDSQRGLAHFLEHMCFNGTTHFPGDRIVKYCESIGVKFGENLNAYTSTDETVYNINDVPVNESNIDSCLLILHDWACDLTLAEPEIDKERGVIHEE
jgi:zinc protease